MSTCFFWGGGERNIMYMLGGYSDVVIPSNKHK